MATRKKSTAKKKSPARKRPAPKKKPSAKKKSGARKASGIKKKTPVKKMVALSQIVIIRRRSNLTFLTESLPSFIRGKPNKFVILAVGGTPPYNFAISQGTLPAGLTLDPQGTLWGIPAQSGDTTIFVKLTDSFGGHLTQAFDLQVR